MAKSPNCNRLVDFVPREEWDFNTNHEGSGGYIGCPDDQLEECKVYECARRTAFWPTVFRFIESNPTPEGPIAPATLWSRIFEFLALFSEFPSTPWLKIDPARREKLLKRFALRGMKRPPLIEVDHYDATLALQMSEMTEEDSNRGPFWDDGNEIFSQYKAADPYLADRFYTFRICWEHSTSRLRDDFMKWALQRRPDATKKFEMSGSHSLRKENLRQALDSLGAWTLTRDRQVSEQFSIERLIKETKSILIDEGGGQRALYSSRKRWREAEQRVETFIQHVVPPRFCLSFELHKLENRAIQDQGDVAVRVDAGLVHFERNWLR